MSRHKYLIVIGTVLFVDVLFLFPYSGIQMVALLHLNNLLATSQMSTLIRWGLQVEEFDICGDGLFFTRTRVEVIQAEVHERVKFPFLRKIHIQR